MLRAMGGAAAVLVTAAALASCEPVSGSASTPLVSASKPTATAAASSTSTAPPAPTMSFRRITDELDRQRVFLLDDDGVPAGVHSDHIGLGGTAGERVASRVRALFALPCATSAAPAGFTCIVPPGDVTVGRVAVEGDTATMDLVAPGGLRMASEVVEWMLVQEIVYTATEEPGVERLRLTVNGAPVSTSAGSTLAGAMRREDVFGYGVSGPLGLENGLNDSGLGSTASTQLRYVSTTVEGALARITFEGLVADGKPGPVPTFEVGMRAAAPDSATGGKYVLGVEAPIGVAGGGAAHVEFLNRTPVVSVTHGGTFTAIAVDDARPWRAYLTDASHLVVEIGGNPHRISESIALWSPDSSGRVARTFHLRGAARVFEADVSWKIVDDHGVVAAQGVTKASLGTSPLWGVFDAEITVPTTLPNGPVLPVLRVYSVSMRDGSEVGAVGIPIAIR